MLLFFRNSYFINTLLLLPYTLLLRAKSLIYPASYSLTNHDSILFRWIIGPLEANPLLQSITASLLIFITAVIINHMIKISRLCAPMGLFSGAFYILLMSILPEFLSLHPIHVGNLLLAISILFITQLYKKHFAFGDIFNIGFCMGLAALIYLPYLAIIPATVIGIFVMRSFRMQERIIFFMAIICTSYLLTAFLYWHKNLHSFWPIYIVENINFKIDISQIGQFNTTFRLLLFVLLILYAASKAYSLSSKKSVVARKTLSAIYWTMFFTIPGIFLTSELDMRFLQMIVLPISIIIGLSIFQWKNKALAEVLHFTFLIVLIGFQYSDQILALLQEF